MVVIGIAEVLVARSVPSRADRVEAAEHLGLDLELLEDRLHHDVGLCRRRRDRWSVVIRSSAACASSRGDPALLCELRQGRGNGVASPCDRLLDSTSCRITSCPATPKPVQFRRPSGRPPPPRFSCFEAIRAGCASPGGAHNGGVPAWSTYSYLFGPLVALGDHGRDRVAAALGVPRRRLAGGRAMPQAGGRPTITASWCRSPAPRTTCAPRCSAGCWPTAGSRSNLVRTTDGPRLMVWEADRDRALDLLSRGGV